MMELLSSGCFLLPLLAWIFCYLPLRGRFFEMDWGRGEGSFFAPFSLFRRIYWTIFFLGLAASYYFTHGLYEALAIPFLASSIYAFLFIVWITFCYESFLHSRYSTQGKSNYSGFRYAWTLSLAFSSLLLFLSSLCLGLAALIEK